MLEKAIFEWVYMMAMQKVPRELFRDVRRAGPGIDRFEVMERYVLKRLMEAGQYDAPIDEAFIKAGYRILRNLPDSTQRISAA